MSIMNHSILRKFAVVSLHNLGVPGIALLICLLSFGGTRLHAQAIPTASSAGDLQIGAMYNYANTDYRPNKFNGYGFYATFDFKYHIGIEGEFHQINDSDPKDDIFERTYEIGPRYVLHHGRYNPYAKLMFGRGVFQYPLMVDNEGNLTHTAQLAYNIGAIGAGLDYRVLPGLNARVEYEYQQWFSFPPHGLTPQMLSVGVAYRFH
jgi:Outer membrane protein beta-barrel domain